MIYGLMITSPLHVPAEHTHSPVCVCVVVCVWPFAKYFILTCHVDNCRHRQVASQQLRIYLSHCISKLFISALPQRDELCCISKRARWKLAATWAWLKSGPNIWLRHKERSSTSRLVCLKRHTDTWIPRSGSDGKSFNSAFKWSTASSDQTAISQEWLMFSFNSPSCCHIKRNSARGV